jgi:hypothetical protein
MLGVVNHVTMIPIPSPLVEKNRFQCVVARPVLTNYRASLMELRMGEKKIEAARDGVSAFVEFC